MGGKGSEMTTVGPVVISIMLMDSIQSTSWVSRSERRATNPYVGKPRDPHGYQHDDAEAPTILRAIQAFSSSIT